MGLYTIIWLVLYLIIYHLRYLNCLLLEIVLHYITFHVSYPCILMLNVLVYVFLCCLILTCLVTDIGFVEHILID
jgi:hypothetical protein